MAITEKSKVVILPEDFQEKRSLAPGAQVMTIGELRNMFFKPFNWNGLYTNNPTDISYPVMHNAMFGNFIGANFENVSIPSYFGITDILTYGCNLSDSNFRFATLPIYMSSFNGCIFDRAIFYGPYSDIIDFIACSFIDASMAGSEIGNAINNISFQECDLTNANLSGVIFNRSVTFTNCKMDGVNLDNAVIDSTGGNGPFFFMDCTGLPDDPRQMGNFIFGTGFLYWPPTGTYFNEVFEELFCKTLIVDGVKFSGQNLTNKVFGFYDAGSVVPTVLRNCDFKDTFITMALNGGVALFNNCNFYGAINLTDDPNNNAMIGEVDGAVIRWIDGAYWTYIAEQGTWVKQ